MYVLEGECLRVDRGNSAPGYKMIKNLDSAAKCAAECNKDSRCKSFAYTPTCHLKSTAAIFIKVINVISGNKADCKGKVHNNKCSYN